MEKQCKNCGKFYEPKKANGVFCADLCRVQFNRIKTEGVDGTIWRHTFLPPRYLENLIRLQDLTNPNLEIKPVEPPKTNFHTNTSKKPEKPVNEEKTVSGEDNKPIGDIEKQIQAIMNETKPANMSFPQWNTSRRKRIEALKNQQNG
jgi:hypothetical protein